MSKRDGYMAIAKARSETKDYLTHNSCTNTTIRTLVYASPTDVFTTLRQPRLLAASTIVTASEIIATASIIIVVKL